MDTSEILSIIIFGSSARGESDIYSDLDVCVITTEKISDIQSDLLKQRISIEYGFVEEEITVYSSSQIEDMIKYGSLFLWHLKLEGKIVYDDGYFNDIIKEIARYDKHLVELRYHAELLDDIEVSLDKYSIINELDLSQLFTICRNTCMILAHFNNRYAFGRNSAFVAASGIYADLPLKHDDYDYLSRWKLRYERGLYCEIELPSRQEFDKLLRDTKKLLYYSIEKVTLNGKHTSRS
jgi:predicted nucleotidyltransferase